LVLGLCHCVYRCTPSCVERAGSAPDDVTFYACLRVPFKSTSADFIYSCSLDKAYKTLLVFRASEQPPKVEPGIQNIQTSIHIFGGWPANRKADPQNDLTLSAHHRVLVMDSICGRLLDCHRQITVQWCNTIHDVLHDLNWTGSQEAPLACSAVIRQQHALSDAFHVLPALLQPRVAQLC
jgi:hypothetical protein